MEVDRLMNKGLWIINPVTEIKALSYDNFLRLLAARCLTYDLRRGWINKFIEKLMLRTYKIIFNAKELECGQQQMNFMLLTWLLILWRTWIRNFKVAEAKLGTIQDFVSSSIVHWIPTE